MSGPPLALALCFGILSTACGGGGGGGGPGPVSPVEELTITPLFALTMHGDANVGYQINATGDMRVGDMDALFLPGVSVPVRTLYQFDRSALPAGAQVVSARVETWITGGSGNTATLGQLMVDHIDWKLGELLTLDHADGKPTGVADEPLQKPSFEPFGQPGRRFANVTEQVHVGRATTSFRVRFEIPTNGDTTDDGFVLGGFHAPTNQTWIPKLHLTYFVPTP